MATIHQRFVLVTGANKGIGLAVVERLLKEWQDTFVFLCSRNGGNGDAAVQKLVKENGDGYRSRVQAVVMDVADKASVEAAAKVVKLTLGDNHSLFFIINNAGMYGKGSGENEKLETLDHVLNTNVYGVHNVVSAFLPLLDKVHGRIANVSSGSAPNFVQKVPSADVVKFLTTPAKTTTWKEIDGFIQKVRAAFQSGKVDEELKAMGLMAREADSGISYGLSKALLNLYTITLAREHPHLHVNSCSPGFIETDMTKPFTEGKQKTLAEMGALPVERGAIPVCMLAMTEDDKLATGWYYGSDCQRSPLHKYRQPGSAPYEPEQQEK